MAHPIVEKAKVFGIKHGEKVAVALVSAVTLYMLFSALTRPSIDITADQITSATNRARQNLQKEQPKEEIAKKLVDQGIVQPDFVQVVDSRKPGTADASRYQLSNLMVSPEPGAGLLRDTPELIAVSRIETHPGRGAIKLMEIDPKTGDVVYEDPSEAEEPAKKSTSRRSRSRNSRGAGGMAGYGMMGGRQNQEETAQEKRDREKAERESASSLRKSIAGNVTAPTESTEEPEATPAGAQPKKVLHGVRWVAFTAWIDHKKLRENYARALKVDRAAANPHYLRVELERQQRGPNGDWTSWKPVDRKYSQDTVLSLLTEIDDETNDQGVAITSQDVRLGELVDQLPFLENGYWVGVHHADLINLKALEAPKKPSGNNAYGAMGMGGMNRGGMAQGPMGGAMNKGGAMGGGMTRGGARGKSRGGDGDESNAFSRFFGAGSRGGDSNFPTSNSEKLMIRQLDFSVEPEAVYRYRARIVVANPNFDSTDVMPGVDHESRELYGPWSDVSPVAAVPPDVETYVYRPAPADLRVKRPDLIEFNVVRFLPENGLTIVRSFTQAPGQIVGEPASAVMPQEDKGKVKKVAKSVDFTSRRVLVDTGGSQVSSDRLGVNTSAFNPPAMAVLLRPDGMIELRDEAYDLAAGEMSEMMNIHKQTLKDLEAGEKKSSQMNNSSMGGMGGYGAMGGGYGGGMGGGYGGIGGGGGRGGRRGGR